MSVEIRTFFESIRPRYPELSGQVAIVTGSSRRIGRGIAFRLAREGMRVVINSRTVEACEATTAELRSVGAEVLCVPADMGRPEDVERLFASTLQAFGSVHLLVNNAADLRRYSVFDPGTESLVDSQLAANVRGPYVLSLRAARVMKEAGGGNIVNISTVGALRAHWQGLPYDVTKGAMDSMTRAMAIELAEFGIRVNAIAPGPIVGYRRPRPGDAHAQAAAERVPMRCFGEALDIAGAVAFLASPDAAFITGQILYVDGGLTAQLTPRQQPI